MCPYNLTIIVMCKFISDLKHIHPRIIRNQLCLEGFT